MLDRRLLVLRGILDSEEVYLRELDALLTVNSHISAPTLIKTYSSDCATLEKGNVPVEMIFIAAELPLSQLAVVALRGKMILNDSFKNK